jgi:hypothetical protein
VLGLKLVIWKTLWFLLVVGFSGSGEKHLASFLGRVNTIKGIRNECEMDKEGENDIQLVET